MKKKKRNSRRKRRVRRRRELRRLEQRSYERAVSALACEHPDLRHNGVCPVCDLSGSARITAVRERVHAPFWDTLVRASYTPVSVSVSGGPFDPEPKS